MSARLILHFVVTLIFFAIGWWLYMRMEDNAYDAIDSVNVAIYWFAVLVYILFSWFFYWIVHRLKLKAWVIGQILAVVIAAVATVSLLFISHEHQKQLEEKAMLEEQKAQTLNSDEEPTHPPENDSEVELETLNLSEGGEVGEPEPE